MLDNEFCTYLEYEISKALANSKKPEQKYLWCDGILLSVVNNEASKKRINDTRKLEGSAYIGHNGEKKYKLTIYFGRKSLSKYARGVRLEDCVPDPENDDWIFLDIERKIIEIQLK